MAQCVYMNKWVYINHNTAEKWNGCDALVCKYKKERLMWDTMVAFCTRPNTTRYNEDFCTHPERKIMHDNFFYFIYWAVQPGNNLLSSMMYRRPFGVSTTIEESEGLFNGCYCDWRTAF